MAQQVHEILDVTHFIDVGYDTAPYKNMCDGVKLLEVLNTVYTLAARRYYLKLDVKFSDWEHQLFSTLRNLMLWSQDSRYLWFQREFVEHASIERAVMCLDRVKLWYPMVPKAATVERATQYLSEFNQRFVLLITKGDQIALYEIASMIKEPNYAETSSPADQPG